MPAPERPPRPESPALSPEDRRRVTRSALLRPLNLLMLASGGVVFAAALPATSLAWLLLPLTLVTYTALVLLAAKDTAFQQRVLGERETPAVTPSARPENISPERRARWLPRGETRQEVEAALISYRKTLKSIEEADDVTRTVLEDAVPKLHAAANRLVDVAHRRERAAGNLQELRSGEASRERETTLREIERELRKADAEISTISEQFLTLQARIIRVSLDSNTATELNSSLDELNFRLEALADTMTSPDDSHSY